jgi:hypothetical protein
MRNNALLINNSAQLSTAILHYHLQLSECSDSIGDGKHFYNALSYQCESLGGIAFHRVWLEAFE